MLVRVEMAESLSGATMTKYVGMIWIADQRGQQVNVTARSLVEAREEVERIYGEGHVISTVIVIK
jgi:hypothetical protein